MRVFNSDYRLRSHPDTVFDAFSLCDVVDGNRLRLRLRYRTVAPHTCRDIIFIGHNPSKAGVPPVAAKKIPWGDNTVNKVLRLAMDPAGDFKLDRAEAPTSINFVNLFALAEPTLTKDDREYLAPRAAISHALAALMENPEAYVICGWGMEGYLSGASGELWREQIETLLQALQDGVCYRYAGPGEKTDQSFEARSWSRTYPKFETLERFSPGI